MHMCLHVSTVMGVCSFARELSKRSVYVVPPRYIIWLTAPGNIYKVICSRAYRKWSSARAPNRKIALEILLHSHRAT